MRGRKPKPTHLKLIEGNPGHRPINRNEPQVEAKIPKAPEHLTQDALAEWHRISRELINLDLISEIDRAAFAVYCQAWGRLVAIERVIATIADSDAGKPSEGMLIKGSMGQLAANPLVRMADRQAAIVLKASAEFGMTPSARGRISRPQGLEDNPLALVLNLPPRRA